MEVALACNVIKNRRDITSRFLADEMPWDTSNCKNKTYSIGRQRDCNEKYSPAMEYGSTKSSQKCADFNEDYRYSSRIRHHASKGKQQKPKYKSSRSSSGDRQQTSLRSPLRSSSRSRSRSRSGFRFQTHSGDRPHLHSSPQKYKNHEVFKKRISKSSSRGDNSTCKDYDVESTVLNKNEIFPNKRCTSTSDKENSFQSIVQTTPERKVCNCDQYNASMNLKPKSGESYNANEDTWPLDEEMADNFDEPLDKEKIQKETEEKLRAILAKEGKDYPPRKSEASHPIFANDGSFMEIFKRMQGQMQQTQQSDSETKQNLPINKRRGGKILKTGIVAKSKPSYSHGISDPKDVYLREVNKYKNMI